MQVTSRVWIIALLSVFLFCSVSQALTLDTNITIWDGSSLTDESVDSFTEDNEVEPYCTPGQQWDLEGFFLDGNTLTMVGGYDFVYGVGDVESGDIFIDIGNTGSDTEGSFGYDYVLDINFGTGSYSVIQLFDNVLISTSPVTYSLNEDSNPWKYISGGDLVASFEFIYEAGLSDDLTGFDSWGAGDNSHYAAAFDLSFLDSNTKFTSHFTMQCGNDNLMGQGTTPVPEPATIVLMAIGLLGLFGLRRMKR